MKRCYNLLLAAAFLALYACVHAQPIPGGVSSAGLTTIVPDVLIWYSTNKLAGSPYNGHVTNGPIYNLGEQVGYTYFGNDHWYQNVSVLGRSTFLIAANAFADDGSWDSSSNLMYGGIIGGGETGTPSAGGKPNQRNIVIFQPVAGGVSKIGEGLYDDFGNPYRLHTMMRQKMGQSSHVAGDKRPGSVNFMTEGMATLWYCKLWHGVDYFNTDGRFSVALPLYGDGYPSGNNQDGEGVLYPGWPTGMPANGVDDVDMSTVQAFSLNTTTLVQTPVSKAQSGPHGRCCTNMVPTTVCNNIQHYAPPSACSTGINGDNWLGYEGDIVALDNGNFVSIVSDPTAFWNPFGDLTAVGREDAVATIFAPNGGVVKETWWVGTNQINHNVAAFSGGFCARVQKLMYFYDNSGNLQHVYSLATNSVPWSDTGRGDNTRLASDIRSHYVYMAGPVGAPTPAGSPYYELGIWDARTGLFVTNALVHNDIGNLDAYGSGDDAGANAELGVNELDMICVAFEGVPPGSGYTGQVLARVLQWDGANVSYLTRTFLPFVNSDNTNNVQALGIAPKFFNTQTPSVGMTRNQICIAAKGTLNSQNNVAAGTDTAVGTTLYTVITAPVGKSVEVNQTPFVGNFTNIQDAINSGATTITITDSGNYVEDLQIGDPNTGGQPVVLTSNQTGDNRPVVTPLNGQSYTTARRSGQLAGFGLFANNSVVSNLIIEAQPDVPAPSNGGGTGAMVIVATNVLVQNCVFRIATNTTGVLSATTSPLLFMGQQGDGAGNATPGGPDCNGCILRNCEFLGVATDASPLEPTPDGNLGYLGQKILATGPGQGSGYVRIDMYTTAGEDVFITIDGCWFHYDRDYGIFPTDLGTGAGSLNVTVNKSRFDANGKFFIRGRGANVTIQNSVFSRAAQVRSSDTQNSAVALGYQDLHVPSGSVNNCVFVNCGSANYQQAYFGGVNNDSGNLLTVDHCTFVDCLSGVTTASQTSGAGGGLGNLSVSNSIFHQIGDNVPRSVDGSAVTLTNGSPELVGGLYPAWTNILAHINNSPPLDQFAAVFNHYNWNNNALMTIGNCLVGSIDSEDSLPWDQVRTNTPPAPTGARLFAGYPTNFVAGTITRATPVFVNQDPDAPNAFQLATGSPGQGLGANLAPILEPRLAFAEAGGQLTISWTEPIWMTGYALKSSPSLSSPVWTAVPGVVNNSVTVSSGSGTKYFAVMKQ